MKEPPSQKPWHVKRNVYCRLDGLVPPGGDNQMIQDLEESYFGFLWLYNVVYYVVHCCGFMLFYYLQVIY